MEERIDPSVIEYIFGNKKVSAEEIDGELLRQCIEFEEQLNAWIDEKEKEERVEEVKK